MGSEAQPCEAIEVFKQDMSHNHVALHGVLLSTKGVYRTDDESQIVHVEAGEVPELVAVCNSCASKLKKGKRPLLSAANNQWFGPQPKALAELTWLERILVSMVRHRVHLSHHVRASQHPNPPLTLVSLVAGDYQNAAPVRQGKVDDRTQVSTHVLYYCI